MNNTEFLEEKYQNVNHIASGGYGDVYLCTKHVGNVEACVAVKITKGSDEEDINTGLKEAITISKLQHPSIIKISDAYVFDNSRKLAIEMEYINDGSLWDVIDKAIKKKEFVEEAVILKVLQQMCSVLIFLKQQQVYHRDIKPANILVKRLPPNDVVFVLSDFGLVKFSNSNPSMSQPVGTKHYMSPEIRPEIIRYNNNAVIPYSYASDMFALGVTLYQLMSLDIVTDIFQLYNIYNNDENAKAKLIANIKNKYSNELINLVMKMLENKAVNRCDTDEILRFFEQNKVVIDNDCKFFKFSEELIYINQFGSKGTEDDQFTYPFDMLINDDLIYVVDTHNNRISVFDMNYNFVNKFYFDFAPTCITYDRKNDNFLIGSYWGNWVKRYSKDFKLLGQFQYGNTSMWKKLGPWVYLSVSKILIDEISGNLLVCYLNERIIRKFTKDGIFLEEFITTDLKRPFDILLNDKNQLVVSDSWGDCIKVFSTGGIRIKTIGTKGNCNSEFYYPSGITFDFVNRRYIVCDEENHRIQIFDENFEHVKTFSEKGERKFEHPRKTLIDYNTRNLYVLDKNNSCIKVYKYK